MGTPDTTGWKRCGCSRLVPPSEWAEPYGCCDDCYWALEDEPDVTLPEYDRERLIDEARD